MSLRFVFVLSLLAHLKAEQRENYFVAISLATWDVPGLTIPPYVRME